MVLQLISDGDRPSGAEWMNDWNEALNISGKNIIRTLIDRSTTFSGTTDDWFAEAYIDASGRLDSVNTTTSITTAFFDTSYYRGLKKRDLSSDTTNTSTIYGSGSWTNTANAFDNNTSTYADWSWNTAGGDYAIAHIGKIFSSPVNIRRLYIKASATGTGGGSRPAYIKLQTWNGSSWDVHSTLVDSATTDVSYDSYLDININNAQGVGLELKATDEAGGALTIDLWVYEIQVFTLDDTEIKHTITTGKFSSTISKSILTPLIQKWDNTYADIQYKLTNATEDSGWLPCGNSPMLSSFTAFTSEPTTLTVKLISSSALYASTTPAIYGVALRCT